MEQDVNDRSDEQVDEQRQADRHVSAGRPAAPVPRSIRELRLALAMRGGVSLAVWMGGACAEIDALRKSSPATEPGESTIAQPAIEAFWKPLLQIAGYETVRIDVLAGTSAGGLNSALLGTSVKYGVDFDEFRDLWLEVGDIRKLVRDVKEPKPRSLLKGDAHFLATMRDVLEQRLADRTPNQGYLDLILTGTIVDALASRRWRTSARRCSSLRTAQPSVSATTWARRTSPGPGRRMRRPDRPNAH